MEAFNKIKSMLSGDKRRIITLVFTVFVGMLVFYVIRNWVRLVTTPLYEPGITTSETFPSLSLETENLSVAKGQSVSVDVVLYPAGNPVNGVDAIISFDSKYLDVQEADITKSISGFGTFIKSIQTDPNPDSTIKSISLAFLTYTNGVPTNPVSTTTPVKLATISFLAKESTQGTVIKYVNNGLANDSNILKVSGNTAVDILTKDNSNNITLLITVPVNTPTPTSAPTPLPTLTPVPTILPIPTTYTCLPSGSRCSYDSQCCSGVCSIIRYRGYCSDLIPELP